jgi:phosphonate transport system substrate-binding protein
MTDQRFDIALVNPFDYPEFVERVGYVPLAQMAVPLVTQFYVRDDSRYHTLEDLRGTIVAMPPAQTANARMAVRALYDNQVIPGRDVQLRYFNSHDSCIQQVWAGSASACGTARPPIRVFEQRMQAKLRAIFDTPPVPHVVFVAHPRVPAEQRTRLRELIVGWSENDAGRALLQNLGFPGFIAARPADYAVMRNYDPAVDVKASTVAPQGQLTLGVFPYIAPRLLAESFAPALPRLSAAAQLPVHLRSAASFDAFREGLTGGVYDLVVVQPFDFAHAAAHGYVPMAGMKSQLQGGFFVREDSRYRKLEDFKGQVIAMPPYDAAQSRLGRLALHDAGLNPGRDVRIDYRRDHGSCLQQVQQGAAAACVTSPMSLRMVPDEVSRKLRPVGSTAAIPGVLFMAHERIPAALRQRLQDEIGGWASSAEGRKILRSIGFGELGPVDVAAYRRMPNFEAGR